MSLYPKKNKIIERFFHWYICTILKKDFQQIHHIEMCMFSTEKSILVLSNHCSWWDGFVLYYSNLTIFKKHFHLLVNARNYLTHRWFKYLGAIGIPTSGKDKLATIIFCKQLLQTPQNSVFLFPQGKLFSQHTTEINLQKGWQRLYTNQQQVVFLHQFTDYLEHRKASLYIYTDVYQGDENLEAAYQNSYKLAKKKHQETLKK